MSTIFLGFAILVYQIYAIWLPLDKSYNILIKLSSGFIGIGYMIYCSHLLEN